MNSEYLNIYNNLIKLTRNKNLYLNLERNDEFSDRLLFLMFHFALFLKKFKSEMIKTLTGQFKGNVSRDEVMRTISGKKQKVVRLKYSDNVCLDDINKNDINFFYDKKISNYLKANIIFGKDI